MGYVPGRLIIVLSVGLLVCACEARGGARVARPETGPGLTASSATAPTAEKIPARVTPKEADDAFQRGLDAVKQENWSLAARYFTKAQEGKPWELKVLFNLGLAHGKAGNELRAIAWLEAYLAAAPDARNRDAVRAEIDRLEKAAVAEADKLFQSAREAADRLSDKEAKVDCYTQIAISQARAGHLQKALETSKRKSELNKEEHDESRKTSWHCSIYVERLRDVGNLPEAETVLSKITEDYNRNEAKASIAQIHTSKGNIAAATKLIESMEVGWKRNWELRRIAEKCLEEGDFIQVEDLMSKADEDGRETLLFDMIEKRVERGEIQEAQAEAERIQRKDGWQKLAAAKVIAVALLEAGDVAGAKAVARSVLSHKDARKFPAIPAILGNTTAALSVIGMKDAGLGYSVFSSAYEMRRDIEYGQVAYIQALLGDVEGAKKTVQRAEALPEKNRSGWAGAFLAKALARQGKVDEALSHISSSKSWVRHKLLPEIIVERIKAGDLAGAEKCFSFLPVRHDKEWERWTGVSLGEVPNRGLAPLAEARMEAALKLAQAYQAKGAMDGAKRVLGNAVMATGALNVMCDVKVTRLLQEILTLQEKIGDKEGADATRPLIPSAKLRRWVELAVRFTRNPEVSNFEAELEKKAKGEAKDLPKSIAWLTEKAKGQPMLAIRAARVGE